MADKLNLGKKLKKVLQDDQSEEEVLEIQSNKEKEALESGALGSNKNKTKQNKKPGKETNKVNNRTRQESEEIILDDLSLKDEEMSEASTKINKKKDLNKNNVKKHQNDNPQNTNNQTNKNKSDLNHSNLSEDDESNENEMDADEYNNNNPKNKKNEENLKSKGKANNYKGRRNLHYLPFKMEYDGFAEVDTFFESLIREDPSKEENFVTSFRGRVFNGRRVKTNLDDETTNFGVVHAFFKKDGKGNLYLENETNLKDYYVWKFDEDLDDYKNQNLLQINKLVEDLGKLA